jgi:hypothetical protein
MGSSSKPPPAPDPATVAAATTKSNKDTAIANYQLGATNQTNQFGGGTNYAQTGTWPDGTPKFEVTQSLDPNAKAAYDAASNNLLTTLHTPFDLNGNNGVETRLMDLGRARLDPIFQQRQNALETKLLNSGYQRGSVGWNQQMDQFSREQNDAYNQLLLTGRGQAVNELMAQRQMPMQEYTGLTSSRPFGNNNITTPSGTVAPTDTAGIYNNAYQNQLAQYGIEKKSSDAMMGGLFGLGGTVLGGLAGGPIGASLLGGLGSNLVSGATGGQGFGTGTRGSTWW